MHVGPKEQEAEVSGESEAAWADGRHQAQSLRAAASPTQTAHDPPAHDVCPPLHTMALGFPLELTTFHPPLLSCWARNSPRAVKRKP